ncbi:Histidine kinase-like ATPase domain-containing protein [Streptomyces sp. DconLS]|nr:Histidine kinase-like ATPase domain-containing protein [Streptomyces sp. LamerLS-31b]SCF96882.1 Histidine kinase-like ATPase domain-containing protein [Streptomyces sp. DconLS]
MADWFFLRVGVMPVELPVPPVRHPAQSRTNNLYGIAYCRRVVTLRDLRPVNEQIELLRQRDQFYTRARRSVPAARRFAEWSLSYWGLTDWERSADVLLCVSELATNAVVHGVPPGRGFLLRLCHEAALVRVEVHDSGTGVPAVAHPTLDEGGRGLLLVSALSDKWGVGQRSPGKIVWCDFAVAWGRSVT